MLVIICMTEIVLLLYFSYYQNNVGILLFGALYLDISKKIDLKVGNGFFQILNFFDNITSENIVYGFSLKIEFSLVNYRKNFT